MSIQQKLRSRINRLLGKREKHGSETAKMRHLVLPFCHGLGCDVGFGGDKVKKENCIGIDFARPYAYAGEDKVDIACDLSKEPIPVADSYFDYVYSSHLIEDFEDTKKILREFIRILKSGGNLILVFPDQQAYEKICRQTGQPLNAYHIHQDMGYAFMMARLQELKERDNLNIELLFKSDCEIDYNVAMVIKITK